MTKRRIVRKGTIYKVQFFNEISEEWIFYEEVFHTEQPARDWLNELEEKSPSDKSQWEEVS